MFKNKQNQLNVSMGFIEEKGDLAHAIRCTEQAKERAKDPWLKQACAFRIKMLQEQLSRQQKN